MGTEPPVQLAGIGVGHSDEGGTALLRVARVRELAMGRLKNCLSA